MEKENAASAYRRLKSPNIKTRKRALKIIKTHKKRKILGSNYGKESKNSEKSKSCNNS